MTNTLVRDWVTSPGDLIVDAIEDGLCGREEIRDALCLSETDFESLMGGVLSLSESMAESLSKILGGNPEFWLKMEEQYKLDCIRLSPREDFRENVFVMPKMPQGRWSTVL